MSDPSIGFEHPDLRRLPSRAEIETAADTGSSEPGVNWGERFRRSAERERRLGITAEWLVQHKEGIEQQRATN